MEMLTLSHSVCDGWLGVLVGQDILSDGSRIKVVPLLQTFLFPHGPLAPPPPPASSSNDDGGNQA